MDNEKIKLDYHQSVFIKSTKELTYKALTEGIGDWWGKVDSSIYQEDDIFKVSFGEAYWVFKVIEMHPTHKLTWECIESNQIHAGLKGVKEEWLGTKLFWVIREVGENIEIDFTHKGLIPAFNCYEVCSSAWDFFITDSLKNYLETGNGKPES